MRKEGIDIFKPVQDFLDVFISMSCLKSINQLQLNVSLVVIIFWGVRAWHFDVESLNVNLSEFDDYPVLFGEILRGAVDVQLALSFSGVSVQLPRFQQYLGIFGAQSHFWLGKSRARSARTTKVTR